MEGGSLVQSVRKDEPHKQWSRHHFYVPANTSYWMDEFEMSPVRRSLHDVTEEFRAKVEASMEKSQVVYDGDGIQLRRAPTEEEIQEEREEKKRQIGRAHV